MSAFFVSGTAAAAQAGAGCAPSGPGVRVAAADLYVVDGDTLHGPMRVRYRLIGVNTPELGGHGGTPEPLAVQARAHVRAWLTGRSVVRVIAGQADHDQHGRQLVYVTGVEGESLARSLVRAGLGFRVAMFPNLAINDCLVEAEQQARSDRLGVWSDPYFLPREASALRPADAGFRLVRGRVQKVSYSRTHVWLELEGDLVVKAGHTVLADPEALLGSQVVVRGWMIDRLARGRLESGRARYLMNLYHASALTHE